MGNEMTSGLGLSSNSMEQGHKTVDGPIAVLWDMENCTVPIDVHPENVAGYIRSALHVHPLINGTIKMFSAYGDFHGFTKLLREGCQRTGVKLIDVPNGSKDAADKAILVDMFLFALDNPPPCSIMLISSDVDFSSALHILGQRGYTVILVFPSGQIVSSALTNAGSYVWDWVSLVRGKGLVPPLKLHQILDAKNEEKEAVVCKEMSVASQSSTENNSDDLICTHSGGLTHLKGQLVKLLKTLGGYLSCDNLHSEYEKMFGRPLCVSDYGTSELVDLLKKMSDVVSFEGEGPEKILLLEERSTKAIIEPKTEVSQKRRKRKRCRRRKSQSISPSSPLNDQGHNVLQPGRELDKAEQSQPTPLE